MNESILNTIKSMLGIADGYSAFDAELVAHINTSISELNHIKVGIEDFFIEDKTFTWDEFIPDNKKLQNMAKQYVHINVRLVFDPPANSFVVDSLTKQKDELYWRMYEIAEREGESE